MRWVDEAAKEMFARLEAEQHRDRRRLERMAYAVVGIVAAAVTAGVAFLGNVPPQHTNTPVTYAQMPPDGGEHSPSWVNCGAYDHPVRPEMAVHSLEHGAVWVTYRPDLAADQIARLRELAVHQPYVIVSPYQRLPSPVVATAWHRQLRLPSAADPRLAGFVRSFRLGPQAPQRGGPCSTDSGD